VRIVPERRGGVLELRLDGPPGNVLDRESCEALIAAAREAAKDRTIQALLFTGTGKHFSFGASVPEHRAGEVARFLPRFHELFRVLAEASIPTVAAVRGLCLGGGFELALSCDFLVAEESAAFGVPEITLGVFPPLAAILLPWRCGGGVACDLVLSGRRVSAAEAKELRIASRLCPEGRLEEATAKLLDEEIRPRSAAALRFACRAVRAPLRRLLAGDLPELERIYLAELMGTRDANEGIAAFLEKRKPSWTHE
jgi:cyclohexa-1,5-dienecarbonyl-CoA hydratase